MTLRNLKDRPRPVFKTYSPPTPVLGWGQISIEQSTAETAIAVQNVFVQVTTFDTNGESLNATPDHTNNYITIDIAGTYYVSVPITIESVAGGGATFEFDLFKNNGTIHLDGVHVDRTLAGGGGEAGSATMAGIVPFNQGDTVEVWVENETNTRNLIVEDITLSVIRIGG